MIKTYKKKRYSKKRYSKKRYSKKRYSKKRYSKKRYSKKRYSKNIQKKGGTVKDDEPKIIVIIDQYLANSHNKNKSESQQIAEIIEKLKDDNDDYEHYTQSEWLAVKAFIKINIDNQNVEVE